MAGNCETLHQILFSQAAKNPTACALYWQDKAISYRELAERVRKLAAVIASTGEIGDRVAVLSYNSPQFIELIYAVPAAGKVLVPLNARLAAAEWVDQLGRTQTQLLFVQSALAERLHKHEQHKLTWREVCLDKQYEDFLQQPGATTLPAPVAQDTAWILFTSGSTGRPKGAMLTHAGFMAGLRSAALARPVQEDDRYLYPFPLFHVAAHNVLLQHLYGAAVVLTGAFDAVSTLSACRELGVTTMSLAPTMISMLLEHPDFQPEDLAAVRTIGYGAAAMPPPLLQTLLADTSVGLCQSYGMTELCGSVAFLTVQDHELALANPALLHSVGRPLPTATLRLVDDHGDPTETGQPGEILVRADQCMAGYWDDAEATAQALIDGWLHTGDIGRFDDDGYLYIIDRKKDMVLSGGENIASREVENALRQHPSIKDCAVIGLPDMRWGEVVCAILVTHQDVSDTLLAQHCRTLLAGYKTPRHWHRVDELPLNAAGKVDKPRLRQQLTKPD